MPPQMSLNKDNEADLASSRVHTVLIRLLVRKDVVPLVNISQCR